MCPWSRNHCPARSAVTDLVPVFISQLAPRDRREQMMEAVPAALVIEGDEKQVGAFELVEDARRARRLAMKSQRGAQKRSRIDIT